MKRTGISKFEKRFSLPHPDRWQDPSLFYNRLVNATEDYRKEISDVYFGVSFSYKYHGTYRKYGEVMGAEASDKAIRMLLKVQENFGIPISLTLNDMRQPRELVTDSNLIKEFVRFIGHFYEAGIRRCTISHVHLMNLGVLQDKFPEMHWKNTVNHQVRSPQEVIDYASLGYKTIVLDRCLNRNISELRRIKPIADKYKIEIALLASEGCMPACPFKQEHDSWQAQLEHTGDNYWKSVGVNTCSHIRKEKALISEMDRYALPRTSTDVIWVDREDFDTYADLIDVFKSWGRLISEPPKEYIKQIACWVFTPTERAIRDFATNKLIWASSFKEIYENRLIPFNAWRFNSYVHGGNGEKNWDMLGEVNATNPWLSDKGRSLSQKLQNCKSQCYKCHACEHLYNVEEFDSIINWRKSTKKTEK